MIFVKNNIIFVIYRNNIFIYSAKKREINKVKNVFKVKVNMSDLKSITFYQKMIID